MYRRPIENCYWVEPGKFLAGEYPRRSKYDEAVSRANVKALTDAGVTVFIDLTEEGEQEEGAPPLRPYKCWLDRESQTYYHFPIKDVCPPHSPKTTKAILDKIDAHIAKGDIVYLHCRGGSGRTGTIVGCWLVRHGYPPGPSALDRLAELWAECPKSSSGWWRPSPDTYEQRRYVMEWSEEE